VLDSGLIVNKLSKIIGLTPREINADLSRRMGRVARTMQSEEGRSAGAGPVDWGEGVVAAAQREVLEVLVNEPGLYHDHRDEIAESLFSVPVLRQVAVVLLDALRADGDFSFSALLARIESVSLAESVVELQVAGEQKGNYVSRLTDALRVLRRHSEGFPMIEVNRQKNATGCVAEPDGSGSRENRHSLGLS